MDFTELGRSGLKVSVMGLGCGGPSRIGKATGKARQESIALIQYALDNDINIIDTAELYHTEKLVGEALKGRDRESVILSTKKSVFGRLGTKQIEKSINKSLKALGTDYIDIYHLHAIKSEDYDRIVSNAIPFFNKLKEKGIIRNIGITERFDLDPQHSMLQKALEDDYWDIIMVGFNILNQSAIHKVFPKTSKKKIGTMIMFPVRLAFSRINRLKEIIKKLIDDNKINPCDIDINDPLSFLIHKNGAIDLVDAAYRFCRYESGVNVVLSGTGDIEHLKANIESFSRPPLPNEDLLKLKQIFKNIDSVSGQ